MRCDHVEKSNGISKKSNEPDVPGQRDLQANELCSPFKKRAHDPNALYDAYDESNDTEEKAKSGYLKGVGGYSDCGYKKKG